MAEHDPRIEGNFAEGSNGGEANKSQVRDDRRLVVFFHENAGNLGLRLDYFQTLYHEVNCDVLAIAYRGYSASSGTPSEEGIKQDAEQILTFVHRDLSRYYVDRGGVFVLGRSLGGAVATSALSQIEPDSD